MMDVLERLDRFLTFTANGKPNEVIFITSSYVLAITILVLFCANFFVQKKVDGNPVGCRRVSSPQISSLVDEFDPKYKGNSDGAAGMGNSAARIKGIFVYPIKSCRRVEVEEIEIEDKGCKYDRDFVIAQYLTKVNEQTKESTSSWQLITLRAFPMMAHIRIELWEPDPSASGYSSTARYVQSGGCLVITFPRLVRANFTSIRGLTALFANFPSIVSQLTFTPWTRVSFALPYNPTASQLEELELPTRKVKIWDDWPTGIDMSNCIPKDILNELRHFLHIENPLTIMRKDPHVIREVPHNADDIGSLGYQANTSFADSFPINILGVSSVQEVASLLPQGGVKLSAARFRCNFLIAGSAPFAEEDWRSIQILSGSNQSPLLFHVTNHCTRCSLPNVDPHEEDPRKPNVVKYGQVGYNEPLKTMKSHRAVDESSPGEPCLGMMVIPNSTAVGKKVRIGMEIKVVEYGKHVVEN